MCAEQQGVCISSGISYRHKYTTMPGQNFKYTSLDHNRKEIRLLQILPNNDCRSTLTQDEHQDIRCRLNHAPLRTGHISLSYRWAKSDPMKSIYINGQLFEVSLHLWNFLHVARRKFNSLDRLWIDAICIDQNNVEERNHQVPLMGEIYSNSRLVITWLGTYCPGAQYVKSFRNNHVDSAVSSSFANPTIDSSYPYINHNDNEFQDQEALVDFFENEYWSRAWIVQEILLAQKGYVLVGTNELSWSEILSCWKSINIRTRAGSDLSTTALNRIRSSRFKNLAEAMGNANQPYVSVLAGEKWRWRDLLKGYGEQTCFDFHDRVYALRSLAFESGRITVDYNIGREELFFNALVACGNDKCLCIASHLLGILGLREDASTDSTWTNIALPSGSNLQSLSIDTFRPCIQSEILRTNGPSGLWNELEFEIENDFDWFISLEVNLLECTLTTPQQARAKSSGAADGGLHSIPEQWKAKKGRILRLDSFGLPANLLLRKSMKTRKWRCAAIQFSNEERSTSHYEVFDENQISGLSMRFDRGRETWFLELTRSTLLKILTFGKQHALCDSLSSRKYNFVNVK